MTKKDLWAAAGVLLTMLVLDGLWLGVVTRSFYKNQLGDAMLEQPRFGAAAVFYVLYAAGIVFFAVRPAFEASLGRAALLGALLGFLAYMTYDLSNLATLKTWSVSLAAIDIAWGVCITAASASGGWALAHRMGQP